MRAMNINDCLVAWVDSFLRDRQLIMSVYGKGGKATSVTTCLLESLPTSPVLFAIYIAEI